MRVSLIYMHANTEASRAIAAGIDRPLVAAAKKPKRRAGGDWHVLMRSDPAVGGRLRSGSMRIDSGELGS
jgi:hypothetical protein